MPKRVDVKALVALPVLLVVLVLDLITKAVAVATEDPNARSHAEGRADTGDGVLLG